MEARPREQPLAAARPRRERQRRVAARRLQAQPRQRGARRRPRAGRGQQRAHPVALALAEVLPDDRLEDDRRAAGRRAGEPALEPVRGAGALHRRRMLEGDGERRVEAPQPVDALRPDRRAQRQAGVGVGRIERGGVAARALDDPHRGVERRHPVRDARDPHARLRRPPRPAVALVAVAVPVEVQARAGAELEDPQRRPVFPGDRQEAGEQGRAAGGLVRLAGAGERGGHLARVLLQHGPERRPRALRAGRAAGRRIVPGELRRPAVEDDPVHGGDEPQRERRAVGLAGVRQQDVERRDPERRRRRLPPRAGARTAATPARRGPGWPSIAGAR